MGSATVQEAQLVLILSFVLPLAVSLIVTVGLTWLFYPAILAAWSDKIEWDETELSKSEKPRSPRDDNAPNLAPILLSLVIPAYNEQDRIFVMLRAAYEYLESDAGKATLKQLLLCTENPEGSRAADKLFEANIVEWIIVNDGSKDDTCSVVKDACKKLSAGSATVRQGMQHSWKLISLRVNSGKGAAVKTGMLTARGKFRLMVDADGATDFGPGLELLVEQLSKRVLQGNEDRSTPSRQQESKAAITDGRVAVLGSRAHLENDSVAQRSFMRTLLMHAFHFFVSMLVSNRIHDTQCGFKLFTDVAANAAFGNLHLRRWAFDTELIMVCTSGHLFSGSDNTNSKDSQRGIELIEVGVPWQEVEGSKLNTSKLALAWVSLSMLRDMICVRACYALRIWKVKQ